MKLSLRNECVFIEVKYWIRDRRFFLPGSLTDPGCVSQDLDSSETPSIPGKNLFGGDRGTAIMWKMCPFGDKNFFSEKIFFEWRGTGDSYNVTLTVACWVLTRQYIYGYMEARPLNLSELHSLWVSARKIWLSTHSLGENVYIYLYFGSPSLFSIFLGHLSYSPRTDSRSQVIWRAGSLVS